jgi:hypothetical protein
MAEDFLHLVPASLPSGSLVSLLLNGLVLLFLPNGWQFIIQPYASQRGFGLI